MLLAACIQGGWCVLDVVAPEEERVVDGCPSAVDLWKEATKGEDLARVHALLHHRRQLAVLHDRQEGRPLCAGK